jgi:hypothetical protein
VSSVIRTHVSGVGGEVREDTADTRLRVGMLEAGYASISLRPDRLAGDVERIKRRRDQVEQP